MDGGIRRAVLFGAGKHLIGHGVEGAVQALAKGGVALLDGQVPRSSSRITMSTSFVDMTRFKTQMAVR